MPAAAPHHSLEGLPPEEIRPGETILHHWPSPNGRGLLTDRRCLLLGHPHPLHRAVLWTSDLETVRSLSVTAVDGLPNVEVAVRGPMGGGALSVGGVDPSFGVMVNEVTVFVGYPNECADIQQRIDDARASRCMTLFGRIVPFDGPPAGAPPASTRASVPNEGPSP